MADRELLELAAKAAGIDYHIDHLDGCPKLIADGNVWNPLTFDGQALRLAVKLRLQITITHDSVHAEGLRKGEYAYVGFASDADACEATRRAITRAAAEIGKEMGNE